ncbi:prepilin peptidase [Fusibacter ferrireducens]|uniref:Prepilin peptidase n=1 Tax=Fusibacter ferrireducens TaxID=2785058 RepID=A0ABR9ZTR7_9FIRM|nr:prepilin peptidase [Fusibacter ferrireducens]MBF4693842.1 prepilin peptidase [Fusibacter ferrireducens]
MVILNRLLMLILTYIIPVIISNHVPKKISKKGIAALIVCYWSSALFFSVNEEMLLISIIFGSMVIVEIFIDYWTQDIIPIYIYGAMTISGIVYIFFKNNLLEHFFNSVIVFLGYFVLYILARWYYKEEAFGFGDVLLIFGVGFFLPKAFLLLALLLPFYLALIHLIILKLMGHKLDRSLRIPFGPYIGISGIMLYFMGTQVLSWVNFIFAR